MSTYSAPSLPFSSPDRTRTWRVALADGSTRTVEAPASSVKHGALVLVMPDGCVAAWAPGFCVPANPRPDDDRAALHRAHRPRRS